MWELCAHCHITSFLLVMLALFSKMACTPWPGGRPTAVGMPHAAGRRQSARSSSSTYQHGLGWLWCLWAWNCAGKLLQKKIYIYISHCDILYCSCEALAEQWWCSWLHHHQPSSTSALPIMSLQRWLVALLPRQQTTSTQSTAVCSEAKIKWNIHANIIHFLQPVEPVVYLKAAVCARAGLLLFTCSGRRQNEQDQCPQAQWQAWLWRHRQQHSTKLWGLRWALRCPFSPSSLQAPQAGSSSPDSSLLCQNLSARKGGRPELEPAGSIGR